MAHWKYVPLTIKDFPYADCLSPEARADLEKHLIDREQKEMNRRRFLARCAAKNKGWKTIRIVNDNKYICSRQIKV